MRPLSPFLLLISSMLAAGLASYSTGASTTPVSSDACELKPNYTAIENKVHLAVCKGDNIILEATETIAGHVLVQEITDEAYLSKLKERGLSIIGGKVLGDFALRGHHFDLPKFQMSSVFEDLVDFSDSHFSGSLILQGSVFRKGLLASRLVIEGSALIGDSDDSDYDGAKKPTGTAIQFVRAPHLRVSGDLTIAGATVADEIDLSNSQIAGSLAIMHVTADRINFSAAEVGNQLIFYNCIIQPNKTSRAVENINLYSIRTKQSVYINRVNVDDSRTVMHDDIYLDGAEIEGDLILLGTHLSRMNARSSSISGSLGVGLNGNAPPVWTSWGNESALDLTNAHLGGIRSPERIDVWPASVYFHNLSFKSFSADFCGTNPCPHATSWYGEWLNKQAGERKSFEPYKQLIDLLIAQGQVSEAADLGVTGHDVERADAYQHGELIRWFLLTLYRYTVGYGYKLYWVFFSIFFFVILGAAIFRQTPEARRRQMPIGLFYSFDLLLPIIRLRELHYKIDLKGKARYYFYFHKLVGWALSLILVAALSGITK